DLRDLHSFPTRRSSDLPDTIVDLGIPMPDDVVRGSLGHAERALAVARVLAHALLLGPGEERARDQRAHNDQGDDREGERHAALRSEEHTSELQSLAYLV